jgi:hypothetical protein
MVQELHDPTFVSGTGTGTEVSEYIRRINISWPSSRRGAQGKILLENWKQNADGSYSTGVFDDLVGTEKFSIKARHLTDGGPGSWIDLLTAYITAAPTERQGYDKGRNVIELDIMDRSYLWIDGKAPCVFTPSFGGWDLREACTLLLNQCGDVEDEDIEFPADYTDNPSTLPQPDKSKRTLSFGPDDQLIDALDRLCFTVGWRWYLDPQGNVTFERAQRAGTYTVDFTLDEDTVTDADQIYEVSTQRSTQDVRNRVYVRTVGEDGVTDAAAYKYQPSKDDPTSNYYLGRWQWMVKEDAGIGDPDMLAQTLLYKRLQFSQTIRWTTIARDLWPGDVVQVEVNHLGIDENTKFLITAKNTVLEPMSSGSANLWMDEYEADILTPWS